MLPLWGLAVGIAVGWARRGRLSRLATLPLKGVGLIFAGLALQLLIFPTPWWSQPPLPWGTTAFHVLSYALIAVFFGLNWRLWPLWLMAGGTAANLAVITANGGYMPARLEALRAAGRLEVAQALLSAPDHTYANVVLMGQDTRLNALGDLFFLPPWVPLANAFSLGDLLLMVGLAWLVQGGMVDPQGPLMKGKAPQRHGENPEA